jgi:predicted nucleotidyltransferase
MNHEHVIETLRSHAPELRERGVRHAALFASLARAECTPVADRVLVRRTGAVTIRLSAGGPLFVTGATSAASAPG